MDRAALFSSAPSVSWGTSPPNNTNNNDKKKKMSVSLLYSNLPPLKEHIE